MSNVRRRESHVADRQEYDSHPLLRELSMQQDEQTVRETIHQWHAHTKSGNVSAVLSLMADDVVFLVAGKPVMSGKAEFERGLRTVLEKGRIESAAQVEEVLVSGDLACAMTSLEVSVVPKDGSAPARRHGPTLSVFSRSAQGVWLLKRDANLLTNDDA
jgi:uncharacterized protein (TIGR02246 family)